MSKERELLERCLIADKNGTISVGLIKDIEELLTQPEQLKREPLSDSAICYLYYNVNGEIDKFVRAIEKAHGIGESK